MQILDVIYSTILVATLSHPRIQFRLACSVRICLARNDSPTVVLFSLILPFRGPRKVDLLILYFCRRKPNRRCKGSSKHCILCSFSRGLSKGTLKTRQGVYVGATDAASGIRRPKKGMWAEGSGTAASGLQGLGGFSGVRAE